MAICLSRLRASINLRPIIAALACSASKMAYRDPGDIFFLGGGGGIVDLETIPHYYPDWCNRCGAHRQFDDGLIHVVNLGGGGLFCWYRMVMRSG